MIGLIPKIHTAIGSHVFPIVTLPYFSRDHSIFFRLKFDTYSRGSIMLPPHDSRLLALIARWQLASRKIIAGPRKFNNSDFILIVTMAKRRKF